jgi:hypothetical protein
MTVPVVVVVVAAFSLSQNNVDNVCPSTLAGLRSGVVTVGDDAVSVVGVDGATRSWNMSSPAQAFTNGKDGVVASNGTDLIHFLGKSSITLYEASHVLLGVGDDTNGRWWAFAAVDPSLFGEPDDGSTILAAFSLDGASKLQIGWASGPEFGLTHLSAAGGTVIVTSAEDLGEGVQVYTFDGVTFTKVDGFVSEPVPYNAAPFVLAAVFVDTDTIALLEAPEQTEQSTITTWSVRYVDATSGETQDTWTIGTGDEADAFTRLTRTDDGILATGPAEPWLVDGDGPARPVSGRCITGQITDVLHSVPSPE